VTQVIEVDSRGIDRRRFRVRGVRNPKDAPTTPGVPALGSPNECGDGRIVVEVSYSLGPDESGDHYVEVRYDFPKK